jgi:hypothetical protein
MTDWPEDPIPLPPRSKTGPKSKFELWMCEKIIEVAKQGGHVAEMCVQIGLQSESTFHEWKKTYPEFKEAYNESKLYSKALHERVGFQGMVGQLPKFNHKQWEMTMRNKFPEEYKLGTGGDVTITNTYNQLNLADSSKDELRAKVEQQLEKLRSMGIEYKNVIDTNNKS